MSDNPQYSFEINGLPEDTFSVVSFEGGGGISEVYQFQVTLASKTANLSSDKVIRKACALHLDGFIDKDFTLKGIVFNFREVRKVGELIIYQATMAPRIKLLELTRSSQIFLNKSIPQIIESILQQFNITNYELRFEQTYPVLEYVCQFNESHFAFLSRWMEKLGMYYFFVSPEDTEKLVITDTIISHQDIVEHAFLYEPVSGLDHTVRNKAVKTFTLDYNSVPDSVQVKDYNYSINNVELKRENTVQQEGEIEHYTYGDSFQNTDEAIRITQIRAEEKACRQNVYHGESMAMGIGSGHTFTLRNHYRDDCNAEFLVIRVRHYGHNARYLRAGLSVQGQQDQDNTVYRNSFTAIRSDVQFRSERKTPVPQYTGLLTAVVDASGSGQYAEIDAKGRYKIRLPFDLADRPEGKASCWIRMTQVYAGNTGGTNSFGMHFPLLKGTEVLISFVDGDIDRPVISGAINNESNESPVTEKNSSYNVLRTPSGNRFISNDLKGKEALGFATAGNKVISMFCNSPDSPGKIEATTENAVETSIADSFEAKVGSSVGFTAGTAFEAFGGSKTGITAGLTNELKVGWSLECCPWGQSIAFGEQHAMIHKEIEQAADESITIQAGSTAIVKNFYKSIKKYMIASAVGALATDLGGWAAVAGSQGEYDDIDATAAQIYGSVVGGLGAVTQVLGAAFATYNYQKLKNKMAESFYVVNSVMGQQGVKHVVTSSTASLFSASAEYAIIVKNTPDPGTPITQSSITLTPKAQAIELNNLNGAKISLEQGLSIKLESTDIKLQATPACTQEMSGTKLSLSLTDGGNLAMAAGKVTLQQGATGGAVELTSSGARLTGDSVKGKVACSAAKVQLSGKDQVAINTLSGVILVG